MGKAHSDSGSTHNYNDVFNPTTRLLNILVLRTSAILRSLHPRPHASRISEKDNRILGNPLVAEDRITLDNVNSTFAVQRVGSRKPFIFSEGNAKVSTTFGVEEEDLTGQQK
jgi:hypothetical protein